MGAEKVENGDFFKKKCIPIHKVILHNRKQKEGTECIEQFSLNIKKAKTQNQQPSPYLMYQALPKQGRAGVGGDEQKPQSLAVWVSRLEQGMGPAGAGHGAAALTPAWFLAQEDLSFSAAAAAALPGGRRGRGQQGRPAQPSPCRGTRSAWAGDRGATMLSRRPLTACARHHPGTKKPGRV